MRVKASSREMISSKSHSRKAKETRIDKLAFKVQSLTGYLPKSWLVHLDPHINIFARSHGVNN